MAPGDNHVQFVSHWGTLNTREIMYMLNVCFHLANIDLKYYFMVRAEPIDSHSLLPFCFPILHLSN